MDNNLYKKTLEKVRKSLELSPIKRTDKIKHQIKIIQNKIYYKK